MPIRPLITAAVLAACLLGPHIASAQEVPPPEVRLNGDEVFVSARVNLSDQIVKEIRAGSEKKLIFYVDLFRAWYKWPDEFVLGKKIERDLKCDKIKGEYTVRTAERGKGTETIRYESCDALLAEAVRVDNLKVAGMREFERGRYFIQVTVESRLRNLPPLLGQMFFFVKDVEFRAAKKSPVMKTGGK